MMIWIILLPPVLCLQADEEDADTVIQISTPRGKKRRRISTEPGERLSIIPKLERSFCLTDDDFEVPTHCSVLFVSVCIHVLYLSYMYDS